MKTHSLIVAAAVVGSLIQTNAARADSAFVEMRSKVVKYHDLDLTQPKDARRLYHRIERAARDVCTHEGPVPIEFVVRNSACVVDATERAVVDVNATNLTSYHAARTGGGKPTTTLVRADLDKTRLDKTQGSPK
jgi:UrcA family protein